jgi:Rod binding domain-containing protein
MALPLAATLGVAAAALEAASPLMNASSANMNLARIKAAAEEFESVFLGDMLEAMFEGVGEDDPFNNAEGAATWRSVQTEEMARGIARAGGIGLADHVARHLIAIQESRS